ncbi:hypothetical protein KA005_81825, partial [bacterium]|nr:hypothetical protein [bacterium]
KKWKSGADLADSVDIYCSTIDKQGRLWLGGAGVENKKTVWLVEQDFVQSIALENCLALYGLSVDPDTGILAAVGWNKKLRGRAWFKNPEADWTSGSNISNSFAVTGVIN